MQKRGQVTIFLIVGIIILIIFAGIFFITSKTKKDVLVLEKELPLTLELRDRVKNYVTNCIKEVAVPGVYLLSIQGGLIYATDPNTILLTDNALINYGYLNDFPHFSEKKMEQDLNRYLSESILNCINEFQSFKKQGIVITPVGNTQLETLVSSEYISLNLRYPLEISTDNETLTIEDFSSDLKIPLGRIIQYAKDIVQQQQQHPELLNFGILNNLNKNNPHYFVSIHPYDEFTTIYSISDSETTYNDAPLTFMFAVKKEDYNSAPKLDYISDFVIKKGSLFQYQLSATDAEKDKFIFSSDSTIIPVAENGEINVILTNSGVYFVNFKVQDLKGLSTEQQVRFVIE